jgi:hypothetical protein
VPDWVYWSFPATLGVCYAENPVSDLRRISLPRTPKQIGPELPGEVFGESVSSVAGLEDCLIAPLACVDVDEVAIFGRPVELQDAALVVDGGDLLRLERDLYRVLVHILLLVIGGGTPLRIHRPATSLSPAQRSKLLQRK